MVADRRSHSGIGGRPIFVTFCFLVPGFMIPQYLLLIHKVKEKGKRFWRSCLAVPVLTAQAALRYIGE